jgi:NAD(P)H-dependent flavin oxidoreductase YrpB (nitropropane dioxygenase family)
MTIKTKITEMFGIKHPIASAAMGPYRTIELAVAVSEAGGLGMISFTNRSLDGFEKDQLEALKKNLDYVIEHTQNPFGFNIITSRNIENCDDIISRTMDYINENTRIKEQCLYALSSAGSSKRFPQNKSFQKLRANSQIKHFHVAPALWLADKCVANGVDGLVVTGFEGGGHQSYEKVGSMVLQQQVCRKYPNIPKIACGGYASGQGLAAALSLGSDAIAMGSRFIASKDSEFHDNYKNIAPPSKSSDTIIRTGGLGTIRLWRNKYSLARGLVKTKEEKIAEEKARGMSRAAMEREELLAELKRESDAYFNAYRGNVDDGAVLIGQAIGVIDSVESVSDIIETVVNEAEKSLKNSYSYIQ